jgi:transposase
VLAHIQNTHHPYNLPEPTAKVAYKANRAGVAEAFAEPDARKSLEVDFQLIEQYDEILRDVELHLEQRAKQHDPQAYHRLRSVPGIGKILALTILYEIHDIGRFPRVQDFLSYARLVKCEHRSAGKRLGSGGAKIGNAHLKWAFSEAAVLFLRNNPGGQKHLRRLAGRHGKAKALSILAAKLGRAVYLMLRKERAFDLERFLAQS